MSLPSGFILWTLASPARSLRKAIFVDNGNRLVRVDTVNNAYRGTRVDGDNNAVKDSLSTENGIDGGIKAVVGVTDLGGNRARENGQNCVNVSCN